MPPIPDEVGAEIAAAAEYAARLAADGLALRYEVDPLSGQVTAALCDRDGHLLRELELADALGAGNLLPG